MNRFIRLIKSDVLKKRRYFREAKREITASNLRLLRTLSLVTAGLLVFFYALTPLIVQGWTMTPQHFIFLPVSLVLYAVASLYEKKGSGSNRVVTALCLLFEAVLFTFIILIDVLPYPDAPSSFMPALCIALPVLFILPFYQIYSLVLCFEAVYIIAVCLIKTPFIAQYDLFNAVVGVAFSVAVAQVVTSLRIHDHEIQMKYKQLSTQDSLSGIFNKKACEDAAGRYLCAYNPSVTCALIILDIDDFKNVNDMLGHYSGDILLRSIGKLLSETFRATDIIGRFGGDEFIVLVKGSADHAALEEKCRDMQERFRRSTSMDVSLQVTCSIGGVLAKNQEVDFESLFRQADGALYEAKGAGKNRFVLREYHTEIK